MTTKKKTMLSTIVVAVISLGLGVLFNYLFRSSTFSDDPFLENMRVNMILGALPAMLLTAILLIMDKIKNAMGIEKRSVKPYVIITTVIYFFMMIGLGILNAENKSSFIYFDISELCTFFYALGFCNVVLTLFLLDIDDKEYVVLFDNYKLNFRRANKPNRDNHPVTIKKLCEPEVYFEDFDYRSSYEESASAIMQMAEEEAKEAIFDNELEYGTNGDWFLSRIDFLANDDLEYPELHYYMTFINKNVKNYTLYGFIDYYKKVTETDFCRIDCIFEYRGSDEEQPFVFKDIEVELL